MSYNVKIETPDIKYLNGGLYESWKVESGKWKVETVAGRRYLLY